MKKSHTGFQLVPKSVTVNDLQRRKLMTINSLKAVFVLSYRIRWLLGANCVKTFEDRFILSATKCSQTSLVFDKPKRAIISHFPPNLTHLIILASQRSYTPWYFFFPFVMRRHASHSAQSHTIIKHAKGSYMIARPSQQHWALLNTFIRTKQRKKDTKRTAQKQQYTA